MVQVRFARVVPCCRHPRLPRTRLVLAPLQVPHTPTPSLWCSRLSPVCVLLAPHEWQLACPAGVLSVLQVSLWCVFTHVLSACTVCTPCASNAVPLRGPPPLLSLPPTLSLPYPSPPFRPFLSPSLPPAPSRLPLPLPSSWEGSGGSSGDAHSVSSLQMRLSGCVLRAVLAPSHRVLEPLLQVCAEYTPYGKMQRVYTNFQPTTLQLSRLASSSPQGSYERGCDSVRWGIEEGRWIGAALRRATKGALGAAQVSLSLSVPLPGLSFSLCLSFFLCPTHEA